MVAGSVTSAALPGAAAWDFIVGDRFIAALSAPASDASTSAFAEAASDGNVSVEALVGRIPIGSSDAVSSFAIVWWPAVGSSEVTAVVRGDAVVDLTSPGGTRRFDAHGIRPWHLADFSDVVALRITAADAPLDRLGEATDLIHHPRASVRASSIEWASARTASARTASAPTASAPTASAPRTRAGNSAVVDADTIVVPRTRMPVPGHATPPYAPTEWRADHADGADTALMHGRDRPHPAMTIPAVDDTLVGPPTRPIVLPPLPLTPPMPAAPSTSALEPMPPEVEPPTSRAAPIRIGTPPATAGVEPAAAGPPPSAGAESGSQVPAFRIGAGPAHPVTVPVLIGRRPLARRIPGVAGAAPELVTVASPQAVVSGTHLELRLEGSRLVATDLRSTNGTVVLAASGVRRMRAGESIVVTPGTSLDLGDGTIVEILLAPQAPPERSHTDSRLHP
jgi:pSer/pThr/pTyr-binding forkhead associated (FHA) protein